MRGRRFFPAFYNRLKLKHPYLIIFIHTRRQDHDVARDALAIPSIFKSIVFATSKVFKYFIYYIFYRFLFYFFFNDNNLRLFLNEILIDIDPISILNRN